MKTDNNSVKEPLIHITKRAYMEPWKAILVRVIAFVCGLVVSGGVALLLIDKLRENPGRILEFYKCFFDGSFANSIMTWRFVKNVSTLLCISLALTPVFKMKFWNIGAEGQTLMGVLACVAVMWYLGDKLPSGVLLLLELAAALAAGILWAGIPGFFKAKFNTNETLFTLMMNYVAAEVVSYFLLLWIPSGNAMWVLNSETHSGWLPVVVHNNFLMALIVLLLAVALFVYLKYSKHGYEISVVGESERTAKYIGVNVKKVILRTVIFSGALCGLAGFLIGAGVNHSVTSDAIGGQGFTGIMVSWLANFNPLTMIATSGLITFLNLGAQQISTVFYVSGSLPDVIIGIILFFIIGCEFFIHYNVHFRKKKKDVAKEDKVCTGS